MLDVHYDTLDLSTFIPLAEKLDIFLSRVYHFNFHLSFSLSFLSKC